MTTKIHADTGIEFPDSTIQSSAAYTKDESKGPAFSAWTAINIGMAPSTFQLVQFNQEDFDTANAQNNGVFTAPIAGYYQINAALVLGIGAVGAVVVSLFKNGVRYSDVGVGVPPMGNVGFAGSALVYLAAGDTVDLRAYSAAAGNEITGVSRNNSNFSGFLARRT